MFDILIENGQVIDGTGNPWFKANIGIKDGKITKVSRLPLKDGEKVIDAKDLVVAPGFVDTHTHSDVNILYHPRCENLIRQGITLAVMGSCGGAIAPISEDYQDVVKKQLQLYSPEPELVVVDWLTIEEFRQKAERKGFAMNFAYHCGQNTIRKSVMGPERLGEDYRKLVMPNKEELEEMKKMVAGAMEDGAFGMANGLTNNTIYPEETIELCKVVARYGGIHDTHHRGNYGDTLMEGTKEAIMIGEKAGIPVNISHHYAIFPWNWGKSRETMRLVAEARARGIQVTSDLYPWNYCTMSNPVSLLVPGGTMSQRAHRSMGADLTLEKMLSDMRDPKKWETMKNELEEAWETEQAQTLEKKKPLLEHGIKIGDAFHPRFSMCIISSKTHPELVGKYLNEVEEIMGMDYRDALRKIILDDEGTTLTTLGGYSNEDQIHVLKQPFTTVESDGKARDWPPSSLRPAHPRHYGSHTRVLAHYVRKLKVLTLEDAIRKFTSLSAQLLCLNDRGLLKEGMWADVAIFDPENVKPIGDYKNPYRFSEGVPYVIVNGQLVLDDGKHTDSISGKILRHPIS